MNNAATYRTTNLYQTRRALAVAAVRKVQADPANETLRRAARRAVELWTSGVDPDAPKATAKPQLLRFGAPTPIAETRAEREERLDREAREALWREQVAAAKRTEAEERRQAKAKAQAEAEAGVPDTIMEGYADLRHRPLNPPRRGTH